MTVELAQISAWEQRLEIHLDLIGGLAGDMFIAALLDAYPQHERLVQDAIAAVMGPAGVSCSLVAYRDHVLTGRRFNVRAPQPPASKVLFHPAKDHPHATWKSIRGRLVSSPLSQGARAHALAIFQLLADAEGFVHGVPSETVEFHEVGAWDSIADIVGAATLIDVLNVTRWTSSPIPLGSGRVVTAHGLLPVPAPATTHLMLGMATLDDGVAGERVTPTGAAILRYLCPPSREASIPRCYARTLIASGIGFGSRALPGLSNHVRALHFDATEQYPAETRRLNVIEFEVDDQSGEDLATGLERIRAQPGVLDVIQAPVFGKKGRMATHVRVLAQPSALNEVAMACFRETTTIGLRHHSVEGIGLKRSMTETTIDGQTLRVKVVERGGSRTAKTESDDVMAHENHQQRASLRWRAEAAVLDALDGSIGA